VSRAVTANVKIASAAVDLVREVVHNVNSHGSTSRPPRTPEVSHRGSPCRNARRSGWSSSQTRRPPTFPSPP